MRLVNNNRPTDARRSFVKWKRLVSLLGLGGIAMVVISCASSGGTKAGVDAKIPKPVWPPPPADARLAYVQSISSPADLGVKTSWFSGLFNILTGEGRKGTASLVNPFGVALDESGNLCFTDTGAAVVFYFDRAKKKLHRWEAIGKIRFVSPVAVAKQKGIIFVADSALKKVVAFDEKGKLVFETGDELKRPTALALVGEKVLVADTDAHCIAVLDWRGKLQSRFGQRGSAEGDFNFPSHLAADSSGRIYVTDSMNFRVQVFDSNGRFFRSIGKAGDTSGHLSRPKGVAVDTDGHLYIVDALFDNFQIFDEQGRFLLNVGGPGKGMGEFWLPSGIAIGRDNTIYVADSYNRRIQVFQYLSQP